VDRPEILVLLDVMDPPDALDPQDPLEREVRLVSLGAMDLLA
jgi:hypothetical protein